MILFHRSCQAGIRSGTKCDLRCLYYPKTAYRGDRRIATCPSLPASGKLPIGSEPLVGAQEDGHGSITDNVIGARLLPPESRLGSSSAVRLSLGR